MPKTRRYRSVTMTASPGKKLGEVHLTDNERITREVLYMTEEGKVCCTVLIRENVDKANEKKAKNEEKAKKKAEEEQVF